MENRIFSLGTIENNRIVKIIRILFGAVCFGVAVFWLIFNLRSLKNTGALWVTIIFLAGFGFYQIWSGLGYATLFIEISTGYVRLKKNAILPPIVMSAQEIEKIELFPLNLIFILKTKKRILLRFGTTYYETNEKVKDEILKFVDVNNIPLEIIEEKI
jgi:hypothetical protein